MAKYLKINYEEGLAEDDNIADKYVHRNKPFANSPVYHAYINDFQNLTQGIDVRTVYQLNFFVKDVIFDFLPGDVIAVMPENNKEEVEDLLTALNLESKCHLRYHLEILEGPTKKNAVIPKHLPKSSTLFNVFLKYIDIRTSQKKLFLKNCIKYTKDPAEKEKLEFICSPSGSHAYVQMLEENRSLLSVLNLFPSCHPPVELILEHSTPLNPRYFSIASSPYSKHLSIIFSVLELQNGLKGVCTNWLEQIVQNKEYKTIAVPIYFRKPGNFRLSLTNNSPTMLIATGTGLAPFLSFLEHKKYISQSNPDPSLADSWLFYGCRYKRDLLCQNELSSYLHDKVLSKLFTAFSRKGTNKKYVQDRILEHKEEISDFILNKEALVFVCGDTKAVVKDVKKVIVRCFMECKNINLSSAEEILSNFIKNGRFLVNSWT